MLIAIKNLNEGFPEGSHIKVWCFPELSKSTLKAFAKDSVQPSMRKFWALVKIEAVSSSQEWAPIEVYQFTDEITVVRYKWPLIVASVIPGGNVNNSEIVFLKSGLSWMLVSTVALRWL